MGSLRFMVILSVTIVFTVCCTLDTVTASCNVYGTMAQIKRSVKTYSQRFESASGFSTNPYTDTLLVVFDRGTTFRGVSVRMKLLQGPNITSTLMGVLMTANSLYGSVEIRSRASRACVVENRLKCSTPRGYCRRDLIFLSSM